MRSRSQRGYGEPEGGKKITQEEGCEINHEFHYGSGRDKEKTW